MRALQYRFKNAQNFGRTIRLAFLEILVRPAHSYLSHAQDRGPLRGHMGKSVESGSLHLDRKDTFRPGRVDRVGSFTKRRG